MMLTLSGCDKITEIDDPFYIGTIENPNEVYLFRCPLGPQQGCAVDGLPGPGVVAGGADKRHVVIKMVNGGYIWFERVPQEKRGWGNNPERLVGPINELTFRKLQRELQLPEPATVY